MSEGCAETTERRGHPLGGGAVTQRRTPRPRRCVHRLRTFCIELLELVILCPEEEKAQGRRVSESCSQRLWS